MEIPVFLFSIFNRVNFNHGSDSKFRGYFYCLGALNCNFNQSYTSNEEYFTYIKKHKMREIRDI